MLGATALGWGLVCARARAGSALLVAFAAGGLALGVRLDGAARARPGEPSVRDVDGRVAHVERGAGWWSVELAEVAAVDASPLPVPDRVRVQGSSDADGFAEQETGAWIRARLRLRAASDRHNPGGRTRARDFARRGIGAEARLAHPALHVARSEPAAWNSLAGLGRLRGSLAEGLVASGPGGGLLAALAVGDRRGLTREARERFAALGVAHLLAVSGLHLGLVAALSFGVLRHGLRRSAALAARRDTRRLALAGAFAAAAAYALLSGWGVPVRRALVLLGAAALAVARTRPARRAEPLAAAALWILSREPQALFGAGPQLSFAATAALVFGAPDGGARTERGRLRRLAGDALRASALAVAVTAPIAAWQLGRGAPWALPANLVAIPWTACALLPAALAAAVAAAFPDASLSGVVLRAAERLAAASLAAVDGVAAELPPGAEHTGAGPLGIALAGALAALAVAARRTGVRVALALAVGAVLALAPPGRIAPPPPRLVALDVGQSGGHRVPGPGRGGLGP